MVSLSVSPSPNVSTVYSILVTPDLLPAWSSLLSSELVFLSSHAVSLLWCQAGILNPACLKPIFGHSHWTKFSGHLPSLGRSAIFKLSRLTPLGGGAQFLILSSHLLYRNSALPITHAQRMTQSVPCTPLLHLGSLHHTELF